MRSSLPVSLLSITALLGALSLGVRAIQSKSELQPKASIDSLILQQIQSASDLTTTRYVIEVIVPVSQPRTIAGVKVTESELLYVAHGVVEAGFDLSQATTDGESINLPVPQIVDSKIDVNKSYVYSSSNGVLNLGPNTIQFQSIAQKEALKKMVESACNNGILNEAKNRGYLVVKELVKSDSISIEESKSCGTPRE